VQRGDAYTSARIESFIFFSWFRGSNTILCLYFAAASIATSVGNHLLKRARNGVDAESELGYDDRRYSIAGIAVSFIHSTLTYPCT
jgi:hypothetical protein